MWPFKKKEKEIPKEELIESEELEKFYSDGFKLCKIFYSKIHLDGDTSTEARLYYFLLMKENQRKYYCTMSVASFRKKLKYAQFNNFHTEIIIPWLSGYNFSNIPKNLEEINNEELDFYKILKGEKPSLIEEFKYNYV